MTRTEQRRQFALTALSAIREDPDLLADPDVFCELRAALRDADRIRREAAERRDGGRRGHPLPQPPRPLAPGARSPRPGSAAHFAYGVLHDAGGGPLPLSALVERMRLRGWRSAAKCPAGVVSGLLIADPLFVSPRRGHWALCPVASSEAARALPAAEAELAAVTESLSAELAGVRARMASMAAAAKAAAKGAVAA